MGLLSLMDRLEGRKPHGITVWATTQDGWRFQANVRLKEGDGWSIGFGKTVEDALITAIEACLAGSHSHTDVPATRARDALRAAADPDDDDGFRKSKPFGRIDKPGPDRDPPRRERATRDERPQGRQERQLR